MRNAYAIARCKAIYDAPYDAVLEQRSWGQQWVVRDGKGHRALAPSLCGNSKQRRQQLRAVLRELNEA